MQHDRNVSTFRVEARIATSSFVFLKFQLELLRPLIEQVRQQIGSCLAGSVKALRISGSRDPVG